MGIVDVDSGVNGDMSGAVFNCLIDLSEEIKKRGIAGDLEKHEKNDILCVIFLLFLLDIPGNISNRSFIVKYGLRCGFWCFITDDWGGLDGNIRNMLISLKRRDLDAANADDAAGAACLAGVASVIDTADAARSIDVIEGLAENVIGQVACALAIGLNRYDSLVDVDIDPNAIDEVDDVAKLV